MSLPIVGAGLLVVGGLINALPPVSDKLKEIFSGKPIFQVLIGIVSTLVGIMLVTRLV